MKVVWTLQAKNELEKILAYGKVEFGEVIMSQFYSKMMTSVSFIEANPLIGHPEVLLRDKEETFRCYTFHSHYKIIYCIIDDSIDIIDIWDTRKEPQSLAGRIS